MTSAGETAERLENAAELCAILSSALQAGLTPQRCLRVAGVAHHDERLHDVAGGLVGLCWNVAVETGAAPGKLLGRLGQALSDLATVMRQATVAAAGPRATLRLVVWLPLASLLIAQVSGIPALTVLLTTVGGWILTASGVVLLFTAQWWLTRLVTRAQQFSWATGFAPDLMAMVLRTSGSPASAMQLVEAIPAHGYLDEAARQRDVDVCHEAHVRSDEWGVPVAAFLELQAQLLRRQSQHDQQTRLAALAVRVLVPLGVCVLPAFVLLAVVPSVLALLSSTALS